MFDGSGFPKSLDESLFDTWLENGRLSKIPYSFLLVIWDAFESEYKPVYTESRDVIDQYESYNGSVGHESLIAAYNLYSESRISLSH